ncbi:MAG: hypothetical protein ACFCAD_21005 [Pleurocapsa sp.]
MNTTQPIPISQYPYFPEIEPVAPEAKRPFWSVMIPTYNNDDYL